MNIHEAIKELKNGNPIYRASDPKKEYFFMVSNKAIGNYYMSNLCEENEYFGSANKTERFNIEEIEATDWEIYSKNCSTTGE
jgi:hypothetical protein